MPSGRWSWSGRADVAAAGTDGRSALRAEAGAGDGRFALDAADAAAGQVDADAVVNKGCVFARFHWRCTLLPRYRGFG